MDYRLSKIVNLIRGLNEEPTMSLGGGKIAGTPESGDHPPVRKKKKKNIYLGIGSRTQWLRNVKKNGK